MTETCFGHLVPDFATILPGLYARMIDRLSTEQIAQVAEAVGVSTLEGLPPSDSHEFRQGYPELLLKINSVFSSNQLADTLASFSEEELASQSLFLGDEGRRTLFDGLDDKRAEITLDHTPDWVLMENGKRALQNYPKYTATLLKQERIKGQLQGQEVISVKFRHQPRAFFLQWVDGPFKGRRVLYNEAVLGPGRVRVREKGLLGLAAVTLPVDSPVARRGTKHLASEFGLSNLVSLMENDYLMAEPRGHIRRINKGIVTENGQRAYRIETRLPQDPSLGYYCYRVIHTIDFIAGYEFKTEIYNFDDQIDEWYHYIDVTLSHALNDRDFDPKNRANKL